ncbi:hypothetical protein A1O3_05737 [Capronia epimyces CBS 606.96]|uniref:Uncharacterized protein n=1 Tax=Capronia epimyces CBS 606.96 TaxID=1182542 RepID=W9XWX0_9EURO|nr:uncharacterized protein A1O3_05737 [Capronia epimyces CBS 606.96]EXJ85062.1 hypothetical protein A1O3_05737 [Capronia epimyces CBS 606.96]
MSWFCFCFYALHFRQLTKVLGIQTQTQPTPPGEPAEPKKVSSKVTKAQRRAQQAEFNRQLWAEAEGPQETNYFLESRNVVPLRSEFKPPPILLSRKGPITHSSKPPSRGLGALNLNKDTNDESSEDEEEADARELSLAERQARAAREREEKQRRYEERRQELFGPANGTQAASQQQPPSNNMSGTSTPSSMTPPASRSATPNRGRGRGGRRGGGGGGGGGPTTVPRTHSRGSQPRELFDPSYVARPDSSYVQRRENGMPSPSVRPTDIQPIRPPRGPDASGRAGFGFANSRIGQIGGHAHGP